MMARPLALSAMIPDFILGVLMTIETLRSIAVQVLAGKGLHEIDFGEMGLPLEERLSLVDQALKRYPTLDPTGLTAEMDRTNLDDNASDSPAE